MTATQIPPNSAGRSASRAPAVPDTSAQGGRDRRVRVVARLPPEVKQRAEYWASKRGFSSVNEYVAEAVSEQIRRENFDYDLPTLEIARLNELTDHITALSANCANLERVVLSGFDTLIQLTRGDNYLLDDESGES
ncbi:hypothetical protein [Amycolatopsis sp. TNS106]|uniref:hypothetical protein n=1 Tax=Amycolatopsis sp. TNS106 TaxID=2861750 RepID=UPI001C5A2D6C|nr:hypothetical protein [Amycolatopsis sp. TNS106]